MPLFERISELLRLSPSRRRIDRQSPTPHQPSDLDLSLSTRPPPSPSPGPRRRTTRENTRNQFSLGSDSELEILSSSPRPKPESLITSRSQAAQRHDNFETLGSGPAATSGKLQPSTFPSASDPSARLERSLQMSTHSRKRSVENQLDQDEARLLGAKFKTKDSKMTPIKPGQFKQNKKKPGDNGSFKPVDKISKISSNARRESGPIRAQGKPKLTQSSPVIANSLEFEESSRPSKRRRSDDGIGNANVKHARSNNLSPPREFVPRHSPASSSFSAKQKKDPVWTHSEFREIENYVSVSNLTSRPDPPQRRFSGDSGDDEKFTARATHQRHSRSQDMSPPRLDELDCVAIPAPKNATGEKSSESQYNRERESSDELQGDVTTDPLPKSLPRRTKQSRPPKLQDQLQSPSRKRSPSDIQPTDFAASPREGPKRAKHFHASESTQFIIKSFRAGMTKRADNADQIVLQLNDTGIELKDKSLGDEPVKVPFSNVHKVTHAGETCLKIRLALRRTVSSNTDRADIEFVVSKSRNKVLQALKKFGVKFIEKDVAHLDNMFYAYDESMKAQANSTKRPFKSQPPTEALEVKQPAPESSIGRRKITSMLQDPIGEPESKPKDKEDYHSDQAGNLDGAVESSENKSKQREASAGVEIPVKTYKPAEDISRPGTRSSQRVTRQSSPRLTAAKPSPVFPPKDEFRKKWKKSLVYPLTGKKRAEVGVDDRDRLREDEFLNDNLIGFYMRFLQDHLERTNPEVSKKVYFFNSYFFETLNNTARGERGINYSGVEKWTRNVDLFSYDYVVVPINQNAHWYIAIICNLPSLELDDKDKEGTSSAAINRKEPSEKLDGNIQDAPQSSCPESTVPSTPVEAEAQRKQSESPRSQLARESFATMRLAEAEAQANSTSANSTENQESSTGQKTLSDIWLSADGTGRSASASKECTPNPKSDAQSTTSTARKGKTKSRGEKYDPKQPSIITFDSLDLPRSSTIKVLREYICKEASTKRQANVDGKDIRGMRAQNIPLQHNWSDCGLYLLAYVEKFVQGPEVFITTILQREMDADEDWPKLKSGVLRKRLRYFLDKLYKEQQALAKGEKIEHVMADQQPVCFLLGKQDSGQDEQNPEEVDAKTLVSPGKDERPSVASSDSDSKKKVPEQSQQSPPKEDDTPDDSAEDEPQLVPTNPIAPRSSERKPSGSPAVDPSSKKDATSAATSDVEEVPDSQPANPTPLSRQSSPDKTKMTRSKKGRTTRKSTIPSSAEILEVGDSQPEEQAPVVQVERTPSPKP